MLVCHFHVVRTIRLMKTVLILASMIMLNQLTILLVLITLFQNRFPLILHINYWDSGWYQRKEKKRKKQTKLRQHVN